MDLIRVEEVLSDIIYCNKADLKRKITKIISSSKDCNPVDFFSDFIHWNSIFAGCVVNLVSRYHMWPYIGEKPNPVQDTRWFNTVNSLANMHFHSVASYIFAAAEDEYDDKGIKIKDERVAHKDMAWFFLNEVFAFADRDIKTRNISQFACAINQRVILGYGVNQPSDIDLLFKNLGFHIGSEKLAALEFQIIYDTLKEYNPDLCRHLENKKMSNGISAMDWLKVHGTVEEEHFNNALIAVQIIFSHFEKCNETYLRVHSKIKEGFWEFAAMQNAFFENYWLAALK